MQHRCVTFEAQTHDCHSAWVDFPQNLPNLRHPGYVTGVSLSLAPPCDFAEDRAGIRLKHDVDGNSGTRMRAPSLHVCLSQLKSMVREATDQFFRQRFHGRSCSSCSLSTIPMEPTRARHPNRMAAVSPIVGQFVFHCSAFEPGIHCNQTQAAHGYAYNSTLWPWAWQHLAIMLPGQKSAFRAGFWPDCSRENIEIDFLAGLRPAGGPISVLFRQQSSQNPARKADLRPGSTIA